MTEVERLAVKHRPQLALQHFYARHDLKTLNQRELESFFDANCVDKVDQHRERREFHDGKLTNLQFWIEQVIIAETNMLELKFMIDLNQCGDRIEAMNYMLVVGELLHNIFRFERLDADRGPFTWDTWRHLQMIARLYS